MIPTSFFFFFLIILQSASADINSTTIAGCPESCGNISIPYPFGISPGCFLDGFNLTCNSAFNPPKLFLDKNHSRIEVTSISLEDGLIYANNPIALPDTINLPTVTKVGPYEMFGNGQFTVSSEHNAFTAIGCGNLASFVSSKSQESYAICAAICQSKAGLKGNSCSGIGCCQSDIPPGITSYEIQLRILNQTQYIADVLSMKAFLVRKDRFSFQPSDLSSTFLNQTTMVPIIIRWMIAGSSCEEAAKNRSNFACRSNNSQCFNSNQTSGYTCKCSEGYQGNPYLPGGCQDIDECKLPVTQECEWCINTPGSYKCGLKSTYLPNKRKLSVLAAVLLGIGIGIGLLIATLVGFLLYRRWKMRGLKKLKVKHFHENRGLLMQQLLCSSEDSTGRSKIFSLEELERATNNFDSSRILGGGGQGTVYKGILSDQRVVAIKRSNAMVQKEIDQFINEVVILSQINHRNVVKLFGCCLETKVPLLVYEFISNGTLSDHLHKSNLASSLSWPDSLRIAKETASALSYLHSAAHISIFHRDVKSANILLTDSFTAKVSDFGSSRLLMVNQTSVTTAVQGTFGYLDPEYYQTSQLTEKSDVYSFGVILAELLTGEKPVSLARHEEQRNLASYFLCAFHQGKLFELVEGRIQKEAKREDIEEFAKLIEMCLRLKGQERPSMKEVEMKLLELTRSRVVKEHPWDQQSIGEMSLLSDKYYISDNSQDATRLYSMENELLLSAKHPR